MLIDFISIVEVIIIISMISKSPTVIPLSLRFIVKHIFFLNIDFFASFEKYHQIINHDGKEIAFVGPSNSGKSSAINALANKSKLAKVSKKPGKTKLFNFFRLNRGYIVDFPGYGYAKTSKEQKKIFL